MRVAGIDYGQVRTGIALSNQTETIASAICVITAKGMTEAVKKTADELKKREADYIVVGLPKNMDGTESVRTESTMMFAKLLGEAAGLEYGFFDETLTTVEAYDCMNITNYRGKKRKKVVDALSAQIILQDYLDFKHSQQKKSERIDTT